MRDLFKGEGAKVISLMNKGEKPIEVKKEAIKEAIRKVIKKAVKKEVKKEVKKVIPKKKK